MGASSMGIIDGDGHVLEYRRALAPFGWTQSGGPGIDPLVAIEPDTIASSMAGGFIRPGAEVGAFDPTVRLADMDREGIDRAVNYPSYLLAVSDIPDVGSSVAACRAYNDWFASAYHDVAPNRLYAAALVPLRDVRAAVAETERAVRELGAVAVMAQPFVGQDLHLSDAHFDELWATMERLGVPLGIHGARHTCAPHLDRASFRNETHFRAMSHPFQQMIAMGDLVLGGVLARFPRLRVAFLESTIAWMPGFIHRLDDSYAQVREDLARPYGGGAERAALDRRPSEYLLGGTCFFSCESDEPHLQASVDFLGEDQVIFNSDYPHFDSKFPESVSRFLACGLPGRQLEKIGARNAERLYGL